MQQSIAVHGDAFKVLRSIPTGTFDHCIADPPYNMSKKKGLSWAFSTHVTMQENWDRFSKEEYFGFSYQWLSEICRVIKPNGNLFVFGTYHNIYTLGFILQQLDRKVLNSIIWVKPNAQPNITCRMLTESSEQLIWACNNSNKDASKWTFHYPKAKELNGGKQMRNVWSIPLTPRRERVAGHPSQKPESLVDRIVLLATNPGDWILDPFAGVGTTGASALRHGRRFFLIEKQSKYVTAQRKRFEAMGLGAKVEYLKGSDLSSLKLPPNEALAPSPRSGRVDERVSV